MGIAFLTLLAFSSPAWAVPPLPEQAQTTPTEGRRKGIHVDHVDRNANDQLAWIRIRVLADTPIKETWSVVQDVGHWDQFMDLFTRVDLLEAHDGESRYKLYISPPWPLSDYYAIVRVRPAPEGHRLDYWIDEGFMYGTFGVISAGQDPQGCWLFFENFGSPQRRFPDWMVKIGVHLAMPSVLRDVRKHVLEVIREEQPSRPKDHAPLPGEASGAPARPDEPAHDLRAPVAQPPAASP